MEELKILVAAGGTGGHLFPALAVIQELQNNKEFNTKVIFVGTKYRIESKIIPKLGYEFHSMPISGFNKIISINTLKMPFRIIKSISITRKIIKNFKPDVVLCTGAYLSYPAGVAAYRLNVPLVLMESNINPGKTIKTLSTKATKIITSFEETAKYFSNISPDKIICLGNPVRIEFKNLPEQTEARLKFGLSMNKKTILIFGGSLGAFSINDTVYKNIEKLKRDDLQILWQTGKNYKITGDLPDNIKTLEFIEDMASAYSSADLIVSRSGATTISELAICAKPSILIPLASASNNEQELNAKLLFHNNAAKLIKNNEVGEKLIQTILDLIYSDTELKLMSENIRKFAKPDAAKNISKILLDLKNYKV